MNTLGSGSCSKHNLPHLLMQCICFNQGMYHTGLKTSAKKGDKDRNGLLHVLIQRNPIDLIILNTVTFNSPPFFLFNSLQNTLDNTDT